MVEETRVSGLTRRALIATTATGGAGLAGAALIFPYGACAGDDEAIELIKRLTGKVAALSDRVHLVMPRTFPTGYTVPLSLVVDSPMTELDHVRRVRVFAPQNPITEVACFNFRPGRSAARTSTRIRLAEPQHVLAVAEMSDDTLLMNKTWVEVATNGCT